MRGEESRLTKTDDGKPYRIVVNETGKSERSDESAEVALENVSYYYDKGTPFEVCALKDVNATFAGGSSTVLFGPSGSGKSTLLEIAAGITAPTAGSVILRGDPGRAMAFLLPEDQMFDHTVEAYLEVGPRNTGVPGRQSDVVIAESVFAFGL